MIGLDSRSLIERARSARLLRVLIVYVIASFGVLEAVDLLGERFGLPTWFFPVGVALLLIGLPVVCATALIQAGPRAERGLHEIELPQEQPRAPWTAPRHWFTWKRAILGGVLAFVGLGSLGMGIVWLQDRVPPMLVASAVKESITSTLLISPKVELPSSLDVSW